MTTKQVVEQEVRWQDMKVEATQTGRVSDIRNVMPLEEYAERMLAQAFDECAIAPIIRNANCADGNQSPVRDQALLTVECHPNEFWKGVVAMDDPDEPVKSLGEAEQLRNVVCAKFGVRPDLIDVRFNSEGKEMNRGQVIRLLEKTCRLFNTYHGQCTPWSRGYQLTGGGNE